MIIKRIFFITLLAFSLITQAQDNITFTAIGKQVVKEGERFRIIYELNADGGAFRNPNFGGLQVLSGPSTSTSSNIQYVNGRMSKSYTMSYSFVVQAGNAGEVQVGPASVTVDGKIVQSNPLTITIVAGGGNTQTTSGGQQKKESNESGMLQDDDVYITVAVNNKNPYLGEQIIATYKIYTKVAVSNLTLDKMTAFNGFWSKSLMGDNAQYRQSTEVINGEEYITAEINKVALFPQKTGKLILEPAEITCTAQLRVQSNQRRGNDPFESFFNDPFFNRNVKNVEARLKSKPITIEVQPLPQKDKPDDFTGAVGDFHFSSKIDRTTLSANDALNLSIELSGNGNIELLTLPEVRFPVDFETFEPKITTSTVPSTTGISGRKKFEYLAIPRNPGDFTIEPITFSFFNPKTKTYERFSSEAYHIKVGKGSGNNNDVTYNASAKEDIRFIGKDIRHIKTIIEPLKPVGNYLFGSLFFFVLLFVIFLIPFILIILWKRMEKQNANVSRVKNRKANKIARMRLQKAEKFKQSGNDKGFYDEMALGIWGYIADKFNISLSELSIETVREKLQNKSVSEEITNNFIQSLNNIEFARFAPGDARDKMESVYNEAITAIMQAEKALK
ncbi:MAG: hypothetical protein A2W85_00705 [Bacteroidetes bacterium GWF2_41_31]|nr:MAG: hypothetical protein A2W85_00705 [Bacteroidetes bacterium GWF2_41_31]